ncbi:MAG: hypothetical protein ACK5NB_08940 [Flavobacteriaceae bacterium]
MKHVIKTLKNSMLIVAVFTALTSSATETSPYSIDDTKTALTLNNVKMGDVLSIKDENGEVLYTEHIKVSGTYKKGFDLTALPNGNYFFEVDKDVEVKIIPFTVTNKNVAFNKNKEYISYKPYVRQKGDMLFVSKLALDREPLQVHIYADGNNGYELLLSEKLEGTQSLEKVYRLEKGNYKLVLISNDKEFTKFINN